MINFKQLDPQCVNRSAIWFR